MKIKTTTIATAPLLEWLVFVFNWQYQVCRTIRSLIHFLVVFYKLKHVLTVQPSTLILGFFFVLIFVSREMKQVHTKTCVQMLAASFIMASNWKQPKCLQSGDISQQQKGTNYWCATIWTHFKSMMLSEQGQTQKATNVPLCFYGSVEKAGL